jgi:hypothetical protein
MSRFREINAHIDWFGFDGEAVIMPICMRSPAVNGRSLIAQLKALKEKEIKTLYLLLCDSLDRHNIISSDAHTLSLKAGEQWLDAYLDTIKIYFPNVMVVRWDHHIRSHPSFSAHLLLMRKLYKTSPEVRLLRDSLSNYYLEGKRRRYEDDYKRGLVTKFDEDLAFQCCSNYLEEEFAGNLVAHEICKGAPHVYWGLYVDDIDIFSRASGRNLTYPTTLPVHLNREGHSVSSSSLYTQELLAA